MLSGLLLGQKWKSGPSCVEFVARAALPAAGPILHLHFLEWSFYRVTHSPVLQLLLPFPLRRTVVSPATPLRRPTPYAARTSSSLSQRSPGPPPQGTNKAFFKFSSLESAGIPQSPEQGVHKILKQKEGCLSSITRLLTLVVVVR